MESHATAQATIGVGPSKRRSKRSPTGIGEPVGAAKRPIHPRLLVIAGLDPLHRRRHRHLLLCHCRRGRDPDQQQHAKGEIHFHRGGFLLENGCFGTSSVYETYSPSAKFWFGHATSHHITSDQIRSDQIASNRSCLRLPALL